MGPPQGIDQMTHRTMSRSSTMELCFTPSHVSDAQVQIFYKAFAIWSEAEKTYSKKRPDWHDTVALTTNISPVAIKWCVAGYFLFCLLVCEIT